MLIPPEYVSGVYFFCHVIKAGVVAVGYDGLGEGFEAVKVHVADIHTCVLHPASETHRQLTDEQLIACGITPDLVRFSVGLENVEDIIADIEQAMKKAF